MILHICNYNMESMEEEEERERKRRMSFSQSPSIKSESLHTSQPFNSHSHSNYLQINLNYDNPRRLTRSPRSKEIQIDQPFLRMVSANREMAVYCFDTLVAHYNSQQPPPPAFDEAQHPLFVTWKKVVNGGEPRLRGCIGTLEARCLINGFKDYALTSALRDRRFPPIQAKELPYLECTVSILTDYETGLNYLDWEIGKHGIIIEFTDSDYNTRRSATYLPEVAAHEGWTKMEAIDSLMRKAGYNGAITETQRKRIRLTRYQSTLFTMHYSEYASYVKTTRGAAPTIAGFKPGN